MAKRHPLGVAAAIALVLSLAVPLAADRPARADDADAGAHAELDEARRLALEAAGRMLRALDMFLGDLPQYAAPEVLPNGDILLRRLNPRQSGDAGEEETGREGEDPGRDQPSSTRATDAPEKDI